MVQHEEGLGSEERLGRQVEEFEPAGPGVRCGFDISVIVDGAVEEGGSHAEVAQRVDLVLHERDEWRHDDGQAFEKQRGQLVTKRLPATCRHDRKRLPAASTLATTSAWSGRKSS